MCRKTMGESGQARPLSPRRTTKCLRCRQGGLRLRLLFSTISNASSDDRLRGLPEPEGSPVDAKFWRLVYPPFSISDFPFRDLGSGYSISADEAREAVEQIRAEGYFQTGPLISSDELRLLVRCVDAVRDHGLEPRFALVYDELFQLMARVQSVLAPVLGDDCLLVPDEPAVYFVEPSDAAAGTHPHRDSLRPADAFRADGRPTLINVWIPFTDVTTDNSCIQVWPAHHDPYFTEKPLPFSQTPMESDQVPMQQVRALPAAAGSLIAWTPHLLHCGAQSSSRATGPRSSMAVYFQSRDVRPYHPFTMPMTGKLPLEYRLYLIAKFRRDRSLSQHRFRRYQRLWLDSNGG